jgi:hypothetical protein
MITPASSTGRCNNKLTENAEWDSQRLLGEQLRILSEAELNFSIELTGFEMGETDMILEGIVSLSGEADATDLQTEPSVTEVSAEGDLWNLGKHRILCATRAFRNQLSETASRPYPHRLSGGFWVSLSGARRKVNRLWS